MSRAELVQDEILSQSFYTYRRVTFKLEISPGRWETQRREVLDRGNGATILLYHKQKKTIVLTKQFRLPTYLNGNHNGMLIEACAGSIEGESPEENIIRETQEETGLHINSPQKIFEAYMSPGAVTEKLYFYIAEYEDSMRLSKGGGNPHEHEYIEVLEIKFSQAIEMMRNNEIQDAKTIMLLQYACIHDLFG